MSLHPTPRGTARALRRAHLQPKFDRADCADDLCSYEFSSSELAQMQYEDDQRARMQLYHDMREEGYSREQALLMSGLADPDSL